MSAILIGIKPGDEVIMPSFTFVSTANAFVLHGAKIIFVDIRPDTMNIDENKIEAAITDKTIAIVPVHYGGVSCEMDTIMAIAAKYNLIVVEDAAQGFGSKYKGNPLGGIGQLGTISFHETKNIHCGEGGAIAINEKKYIERAEIIREKGTNRNKFLRGQIDKYSWVDIGSSYLPSELNAAFLFAQLGEFEKAINHRLIIWKLYYDGLNSLVDKGLIEVPFIPNGCLHNGHMFYIKVKDINQRQNLISFLNEKSIQTVFHYIPLHSSTEGLKVGVFHGKDEFTTKESERILRLPMHSKLNFDDIHYIISCINKFNFK
jgi:dTDP-4-amino-4,6-dideoxygalactose transaminase